MAANGSKRWFMYVADNGTEYAVELDESSYENPTLGFDQLPGQREILSLSSTRPLKPRYVTCSRVENNVTIRARVFIGTAAAFALLQSAGTIVYAGETWNVSRTFGEERTLVPATDTGILDGDVDNNIAAAV